MCTVSFVPKSRGFYLAMNRDEKLDRLTALSPAIVEIERRRAVFPYEPAGGTWISVNDAGVCLSLINWHRIQRKPRHDIFSRGLVVRELAGKSSTDEIATSVKKLPLGKLQPFRLIVIAANEMCVTEWRWNLHRLTRRNCAWTPQHWFSSGFDEPRVEVERAKICAAASGSATNQTLTRLRKLHRSHAPNRGPFSICMHRADAATASYTEVSVVQNLASMRYAIGSPCKNPFTVTKCLPLA